MKHVLKDKSLLVLIFFKGYVCIPRFTPVVCSVYVLLCRKVYARLVESGTLQRHKTMGIFCQAKNLHKFRAFSSLRPSILRRLRHREQQYKNYQITYAIPCTHTWAKIRSNFLQSVSFWPIFLEFSL